MQPDDDFYVGYDDQAPKAIVRFTRAVVVALVTGSLSGAAILAASFSTLSDSRFEFGTLRTFEGRLIEQPYPRLTAAVERETNPETAHPRTIMLAGQGKRGAAGLAHGFDGQTVRLQGTLAQRENNVLVQVEPDTLMPTAGADSREAEAPLRPQTQSRGRQTLRGEVVDSKCYLGVMNPGEGAVHRDCAVRCLAGGIAPALAVRRSDAPTTLVYLAGGSGDALDAAAVSRVAGRTVELSGTVISEGDIEWLHLDAESLAALLR